MSSKRVAIIQSNYIPWKGYFDFIRSVDEFVLYDDMQYTRRDWRNRNQIKTPQGLQWLSIPVETKGRFLQKIKDARIAEKGWAENHWTQLRHAYARAPHFPSHGPRIQALYEKAAGLQLLSEVNELFLKAICVWLGITTRIRWSMEFRLAEGKTERLVDLCRQLGATEYVSGPAARQYVDEGLFRRAGIALRWMDYSGYPEYPQLHGPFVHGVTVLDLILNTGDAAAKYLERAGAEALRRAAG